MSLESHFPQTIDTRDGEESEAQIHILALPLQVM